MPLCQACQRINLRKMLLELAERNAEDDYSKNGFFTSNVPVHKHTIAWEEYKKNCDLCKVLWAKHALKRLLRFKSLKGQSTFDLRVKRSSQGWQDEPIVRLHVSAEGNPNEKTAEEYELRYVEKDVSAEQEDYQKIKTLILRDISPWSGSPESLSLAAQWYRAHKTSAHPLCIERKETIPTPQPMSMPTRVIDVGDESRNPSLHITHGNPGSWLALSYCWGASSDFVLNQKTHDKLAAGLPLSEFPQTIRDAIVITRALNERYLWVDALCIMQDSPEDWQRESGKMAEVYSNASLTVIAAADSSSGVTKGIFHERKVRFSARVTLSMEREEHGDWKLLESLRLDDAGEETNKSPIGGIEICVRAAERPASHLLLNNSPKPKSSPWATRAWTLQEYLLSERTLTYTSSQMLWSCRTCRDLGEDGKFVREDKNEDLPDIWECEDTSNHTDVSAQVRYSRWYRVVTVYSNRNLTYNSDKIVAIASVAKRLNTVFSDEYCVGLWRYDFAAGLCWRLWEPGHKQGSVTTYSKIYPSWSWICVNGGVRYDMTYLKEYAASFRSLINVEDVKISYASENIYGQIERAELVVSGPCYSFRYKDERRPTGGQGPKFPDFIERFLDVDTEFQSRRGEYASPDLTVLQIANASYGLKGNELILPWFAENDFPHEYHFLVLEPVEGSRLGNLPEQSSEYFRRVAHVHVELGNVFTSMEKYKQEEDIEVAREMKAHPWSRKTMTLV